MKDLQHEYFPHDYNASGDENLEKLIMALGNKGCGIYWRIVEKLYQSRGHLQFDLALLAYSLRDDADIINRVLTEFSLFYKKGKIFGSHSVDRRLSERAAKSEQAQQAALSRHHAGEERAQNGRIARKKEGRRENKGGRKQ